jgi:hypothetical protein
MAAPIGNQNGTKTKKPWAEALERALEAHKPSDQRARLAKLAEALVDKAMDGDVTAIKEIGDRLDGKPKQQMDMCLIVLTADRLM